MQLINNVTNQIQLNYGCEYIITQRFPKICVCFYNYITDLSLFKQLKSDETIFQLDDQKQPDPKLIRTSHLIKTIYTTKHQLEKIQQKHIQIRQTKSSICKGKYILNTLKNALLNLTQNLLRVLGTVENASQ
ncbi:Hypothetical_protein [Hexamita inflata]|uniref:Hypothetical_protein n=1 Tax=Hexamita inflata TaxID=28002 RepID=A0AA86PJJ7_9EUKA|nr:Hypothetical protein HINF_LOCUS24472 [Hexamita inflata]